MDVPAQPLTVDEYEPIAKERLSPDVYGFFAGGAGDERTLLANRDAFDRWVFRPRYLRGAGDPDPRTSVLGASLGFPLVVAPWAFARMAHPDGEMALRRAAADAGCLMVVSSTSYDLLEDVAAAAATPAWWQLYLATDRGFSADMLARVVGAGFGAIVWTVDLPAFGLRHRDTRTGFQMPMGLRGDDYEYDPMIAWEDLAWIRDHAPGLPVLVKGILTADDALRAIEHGASGIVVSNHGGRQLDAAPAGLDALAEIAPAVQGRIPVLMDGGVRRGTDIVMAMALGASAVLTARPTIWGLAADGEAGVSAVLRILRDEFINTMALTGCRTVAEITRELVAPAPR